MLEKNDIAIIKNTMVSVLAEYGLTDIRQEIEKRFEAVDERFEKIDQRFETIDARFDEIDQRFEAVDARFDEIDQRFDEIDKDIGELRLNLRYMSNTIIETFDTACQEHEQRLTHLERLAGVH